MNKLLKIYNIKTYPFLSAFCIPTISCANTSEKNRVKRVKENETIARTFIEAWDSKDIDKLCTLFVDDFVYPEVASGHSYTTNEALSNYGNLTIQGIPDSKFEIITLVANEKSAAVEWIWKGTNSVGWDFMGIPATGKYFELPGVSFMEIENRKMKRKM